MKYLTTIVFVLLSVSLCIASCSKDTGTTTAEPEVNSNGDHNNQTGNKMKITVGDKVFIATLNDNATAKAFKAMLPLTITIQ